jgi:two-component system, cell cycle response regulator
LTIYEEVIGVLSVQAELRNAYNEDTLRALNAISRQAAVAIQNAKLYELATVDGLTQLYVRRYFDQRLAEEWHRSTRYNNPFAVIMMDLDNFKQLNDLYGHQTGDRVIRRAAQVARSNLRGADIPSRYGGEEFAIILPRTNLDDACIVAERIRKDLASQSVLAGTITVTISASLGVASYPESGPTSHDDLVGKADIALYEAKEAGKNAVRSARAAVSTPPTLVAVAAKEPSGERKSDA